MSSYCVCECCAALLFFNDSVNYHNCFTYIDVEKTSIGVSDEIHICRHPHCVSSSNNMEEFLRHHLQVHGIIPLHVCSRCGVIFVSAVALTLHMRLHSSL